MDPIESIKIKKDTSFAMLLEAQKRGYQIYYMEMGDLFLQNGKPMANMRSLSVQEDPQSWFTLGEDLRQSLAELDVILMRKDPPFDMNYILYTYLLDLANKGTLVLNHPTSIRSATKSSMP